MSIESFFIQRDAAEQSLFSHCFLSGNERRELERQQDEAEQEIKKDAGSMSKINPMNDKETRIGFIGLGYSEKEITDIYYMFEKVRGD